MFGIFKSKTKSPLRSEGADPGRYAGRPLLLILENLVLHSIGQLPDDKKTVMLSVVQKTFGGGDSWAETLKRELDLGPSIEDSFRLLWEKNSAIAAKEGVSLQPMQFARMVVDSNFASLIDRRFT
ncbi:hypothetical protein [Variovorax sp. DAIF25]|uniref:hypothetical protein n=1 Tax=Variovorax sp. DAIF25 TaxID=3080983 RepID=UPI003D6A50A7